MCSFKTSKIKESKQDKLWKSTELGFDTGLAIVVQEAKKIRIIYCLDLIILLTFRTFSDQER